MNLRKILRRLFGRRSVQPAPLPRIVGHSRPGTERETFAGAVPVSASPEGGSGCRPFVSEAEGAAFIAGEVAALRVLVPREDLAHERAFWLGFLNALRRRGSVGDALRTGGAALLGVSLEGRR